MEIFIVYEPGCFESGPSAMSVWDDETAAGLEAFRMNDKYHQGRDYYYVEPMGLNVAWEDN